MILISVKERTPYQVRATDGKRFLRTGGLPRAESLQELD
jgi:hypothetical protein